jgi:uncharacterized protein YyaL (SSP411 family)
MANRLQHEPSPYLRQHADNPVDWFPWGDEAFARARAEDKPVFLSIGYSTCHWCHVMERESFENAAIAGLLNTHFVAIKVDREERPDLDHLYMTATQATTGTGGWPMSVWLTPDRQPFYCGTYFPAPAFAQLLQRIHEVWTQRRADLAEQAAQLTTALRGYLTGPAASATTLTDAPLHAAFRRWAGLYDPVHGGFGAAPKFPHPVALNFLFRYSARTGNAAARAMALHQLRAMAAGGIHDQVGGGFHRYSVDAAWQEPHYEKMLYDQAQLIGSYLDAGETGIARQTADYVLRDLTSPDGAFYCGEDADSEGVEGKFYQWSAAELEQPRAVLFALRQQRVRPARDEKVLTAWNGQMIAALARLGDVPAASRAARYLLTQHYRDGHLWRTPTVPAMLEDYACFGNSLVDLYEATLDSSWLTKSRELAEQMVASFADVERGGFYQTDGRDPSVLIRAKDTSDDAPLWLLRLDDERYRPLVEKTLACYGDQMLCALDAFLSEPVRITIAGPPELFLQVIRQRYLPNRILVRAEGPASATVCRGRECLLPVTEPAALARLL